MPTAKVTKNVSAAEGGGNVLCSILISIKTKAWLYSFGRHGHHMQPLHLGQYRALEIQATVCGRCVEVPCHPLMGGCNANNILWLNEVFDIHRDEEAIEWIRQEADGYDKGLKILSDSLMQEKLKME